MTVFGTLALLQKLSTHLPAGQEIATGSRESCCTLETTHCGKEHCLGLLSAKENMHQFTILHRHPAAYHTAAESPSLVYRLRQSARVRWYACTLHATLISKQPLPFSFLQSHAQHCLHFPTGTALTMLKALEGNREVACGCTKLKLST